MHFVFNDFNRVLACNTCELGGGAMHKSDEKRKMETEAMITFEDSFQGTPLNCMIKNLILGKFEE